MATSALALVIVQAMSFVTHACVSMTQRPHGPDAHLRTWNAGGGRS